MKHSMIPALLLLSSACSDAGIPSGEEPDASSKVPAGAEVGTSSDDASDGASGVHAGTDTDPGSSPDTDPDTDPNAYTEAEKSELGDYSHYSTAGQYLDAYPDQTPKPDANYPAFSWDTVPRWLAFRSVTKMSDEDIASIAANFQLAMLEKANDQGTGSVEAGTISVATRLKAENPDITTLFYWNTNINYLGYSANDEYNENAWDWSTHTTDDDGKESIFLFKDLYYWYDHTSAGMRDWWIEVPLEMAKDPSIDGVFLDKVLGIEGSYFNEEGKPVTDYIDMMNTLYQELPSDKLLIGNTLRNERYNGNREHMRYMDGSYMERWEFFNRDVDPRQTTVEAIHVSIQLMREALAKGKMINFQTGPSSSDVEAPSDETEAKMKAYYQEALQFPLAVFLIVAEKNAHFSYQGSVNARDETWMWNTSWMEEFSRPLGEPLGRPVRDGNVYTRSFEHLDVEVDVELKTASLNWK